MKYSPDQRSVLILYRQTGYNPIPGKFGNKRKRKAFNFAPKSSRVFTNRVSALRLGDKQAITLLIG